MTQDLDTHIIKSLKENARTSVTQMSKELGVSRVTIDSRIKKMENRGDITGYTVTLGCEDFGQNVTSWVMIDLVAKSEESTICRLNGMPEVTRLFTTSGRWSLAVEIQTETLQEMSLTIAQLRQIPGVRETESSHLLSSRL
ncbi:Lrp/AsnC family transcriptional regulator [Alphaproteobacteria bacterium LSUCC0719]